MNVLVTGANGYLGAVLVEELKATGHDLYLLDSHWRTLPDRTPLVVPGPLTAFLRRADAVVHLGWYSTAGDGQPELQRKCYENTMALGGLVRPFTPRHCRIVFASSSSVYGHCGSRPLTEEDVPAPNCAYTQAKLAAEKVLVDELGDPDRVLTFRFGSLMGLGAPGGRTKTELVVNAFALAGWRRRPIAVWNPDDYKPVIHVRDAARLLRTAVETKGWSGTYNAGLLVKKAGEIAATAAAMTGGEIIEVPDRNGRRSCNLVSDRLLTELPGRTAFLATAKWIPYAIKELKDYLPKPTDWNDPSTWTEG